MNLNLKTSEMLMVEKEHDETPDEIVQRLIRTWRLIKNEFKS